MISSAAILWKSSGSPAEWSGLAPRRACRRRRIARCGTFSPCMSKDARTVELSAERLTIRNIRTVGVEVPMTYALGTSAATVRAAPLLLIDLETEEGITGRSYLFCYLPAAAPAIAGLLGEVLRAVEGERVAPLALWARLEKRFTLIGVQGIVRMAMSGFDVACWDALAIAAGKPLAALLGGTPRPVRAYNSNGLGLMERAALADEAVELLEGGFEALKLRLGYATLEEDIAALRAVRARVP